MPRYTIHINTDTRDSDSYDTCPCEDLRPLTPEIQETLRAYNRLLDTKREELEAIDNKYCQQYDKIVDDFERQKQAAIEALEARFGRNLVKSIDAICADEEAEASAVSNKYDPEIEKYEAIISEYFSPKKRISIRYICLFSLLRTLV